MPPGLSNFGAEAAALCVHDNVLQTSEVLPKRFPCVVKRAHTPTRTYCQLSTRARVPHPSQSLLHLRH